MIKVPDFAPGCFGSALAFNASDSICRNCVFSKECEPTHKRAKEELRNYFGIKVREPKKPLADVCANSPETTLPKKTQALFDRINSANYDIVGKLRSGVNPFGESMKFMAVACQLLLKVQNVKQSTITAGCVYKLGCQEDTAEAYARTAIQILSHVGAIDSNDGIISIRKG
jgi:hypothetical protein